MVFKVFQLYNKNFCVWFNGYSGWLIELLSMEGGGVVGRIWIFYGFIVRFSEGFFQGERGRFGFFWFFIGGVDRELWRFVWNKLIFIVFFVYRNML